MPSDDEVGPPRRRASRGVPKLARRCAPAAWTAARMQPSASSETSRKVSRTDARPQMSRHAMRSISRRRHCAQQLLVPRACRRCGRASLVVRVRARTADARHQLDPPMRALRDPESVTDAANSLAATSRANSAPPLAAQIDRIADPRSRARSMKRMHRLAQDLRHRFAANERASSRARIESHSNRVYRVALGKIRPIGRIRRGEEPVVDALDRVLRSSGSRLIRWFASLRRFSLSGAVGLRVPQHRQPRTAWSFCRADLPWPPCAAGDGACGRRCSWVVSPSICPSSSPSSPASASARVSPPASALTFWILDRCGFDHAFTRGRDVPLFIFAAVVGMVLGARPRILGFSAGGPVRHPRCDAAGCAGGGTPPRACSWSRRR